MNPYFSVGEEVILCSVTMPHLNGEYVVEQVLTQGEMVTCRITGDEGHYLGKTSRYGYRLFGLLIKGSNGGEAVATQQELRKKHKGSDKSFDQIVKSLNLTGVSS